MDISTIRKKLNDGMWVNSTFKAVFRIRIFRIRTFLGLPDPDLLVRGMDPDPSIIMQK
jgi:hypothetical protein